MLIPRRRPRQPRESLKIRGLGFLWAASGGEKIGRRPNFKSRPHVLALDLQLRQSLAKIKRKPLYYINYALKQKIQITRITYRHKLYPYQTKAGRAVLRAA